MRGIVLVFVAGLLALLLLAALAFLSLAAAGAKCVPLERTRATLAAASGMEYAAGRLGHDLFPRNPGDLGARGDDWTFREGPSAPLERTCNPSYGHGEPWTDDPAHAADGLDNDADGLVDEIEEGVGAFSAGEAFSDADRDGRFDAASGRLRGGSFSLKIESAGAKVPVNGGDLAANYNSTGLKNHLGLVHVLNNLGSILRPMGEAPPGGWTRRRDFETGGGSGDRIPVSILGDDLIASRPPGGYRSVEEAGEALKELGYSAVERDLFLPYLEVGTDEALAESGRPRGPAGSVTVFPYIPIELAGAAPEILAALWTRLSTVLKSDVMTSSGWWSAQYPGAGGNWPYLETVSSTTAPVQVAVTIREEEALALAREALMVRRKACSWNMLYEQFLAGAESIFQGDAQELASFPADRDQVLRAKVDLAFHAVALDPFSATSNLACGGSWGVDPAVVPLARRTHPFSVVSVDRSVARTAQPWWQDDPDDPGQWYWWPDDQAPYKWGNSEPLWPQGVTLAPPVRFSVESIGRAGAGSRQARAQGTLRIAERLEFTSQEDFELFSGAAGLSARGISVLSPPERSVATDVSTGRTYPQVVTLPRANPSRVAARKFSRYYGAVGLAAREMGLPAEPGLAYRYWPFSEDGDLDETNDFPFICSPSLPPAAGTFPCEPSADASGSDPWQVVTDGIAPPFASFGLLTGSEDNFVLECWLVKGGKIGIEGDVVVVGTDDVQERIQVEAKAAADVNKGSGALLELSVVWTNARGIVLTGFPAAPKPFFADSDSGRTGAYHVVLTSEKDQGRTLFYLYVNGEPAPGYPAGGVYFPVGPGSVADEDNGELAGRPQVKLAATGADEIRLYDQALGGPGAIRPRYELGRFAPPVSPSGAPFWRSARLGFGEDVRLDRVRWTGMLDPDLAQAVSLAVSVHAFDGNNAPVAGSPVPVPEAGADLSGLGPARSFEYRVDFAPGASAQPLYDTPLFESIWFTSRRPGRTGWTQWRE